MHIREEMKWQYRKKEDLVSLGDSMHLKHLMTALIELENEYETM